MDESSSFHAGITATIRLDVVLSVATGLSKGRDREREREGGKIRRIERWIYKANRPSDGFSESELCGG